MSLKDFEVLGKVGEGAYSTVYRVRRLSDGQIYAMKQVNFFGMDFKGKHNTLNEIRILASITHANIVSYKESFFDEQSRVLCIVMELASKGDLLSLVRSCRASRSHVPEQRIWDVLKQALLGLRVLHALKIIHRDIKCANIFLAEDGTVKMGDLNIAKIAGLARTQTGTPYYASPEVWKDSPYDSKCDIWSLGCSVYELACLEPPFKAGSMRGVYRKVLLGRYPALPSMYSQSLKAIIAKMLCVSPVARPSCEELLAMPTLTKNSQVAEGICPWELALISSIKLPATGRSLQKALPGPKYSNSLSVKTERNKENASPQGLTPSPSTKSHLFRAPRLPRLFVN